MKKLMALVLALTCVFGLVSCAQKKQETAGNSGKDFGEVVDISDWAEAEGLECVKEEEMFYEDESTEYYFSEVRSPHVLVSYRNDYIETVVTALEEGRITIADLDKYGIEYYTKPKE